MTDSTRLGLPYVAAAQAQKHVTHNEALLRLDGLVQLAVLERGRNAPPDAPAEGARYLLGANPTGAFAAQAGRIAAYDDGGWRFFAPQPGWRLLVLSEPALVWFDGAAWRDLGALLRSLDGLAALGIGTGSDSGNPLSAKLNNALLTARGAGEGGSGDLRLKLNKESAAGTVSQLYQTGYSGRAETGLSGDDRYRIKVSADGGSWRDALVVDPATGAVSFPAGIASLAGGSIGGWRNQVLNGDFAVAQRGPGPFTLAAAGGLYGFDGWRLRADAAAQVAMSRSAFAPGPTGGPSGRSYATLSVASAAAGALAGVEQRLEDVQRLAGLTMTLSFWHRGAGAGFTLDLGQDCGAGGSAPVSGLAATALPATAGAWVKRAITLTLPSLGGKTVGVGSFTLLRLALTGAAPAAIDIADIQLEEGPLATPFERRPAHELTAARRHFRRYAAARTAADLAFAMRATPVQSGTGPFDYSAEL